ncbi:actin remodeling regulator NHS-like isoform X2 [Stigmatopora argus]
MPFVKRLVEPRSLCRVEGEAERLEPGQESGPGQCPGGPLFRDLLAVSHAALARSLRQLSDLAKHACSVFAELEGDLAATGRRLRGLQRKVGRLQETCCELDPKQEPVPVSDLDAESKLTCHFRSPWQKQRNHLRPATRPPCVQDLHRDARLWERHAGGQRRERRVSLSISALPPMPLYLSTPIASKKARKRAPFAPVACGDPEWAGGVPVPNRPSTLDKRTNWSRALPLPTPEERMKCDSRVVASSVIPINVTGVGFDRDANARRSLVHSQSLLQRRRRLRRRRTVAGVPGQLRDFALDSDGSPVGRGVFVHAGPSIEDASAHHLTRDSGCQTEEFLTPGAPSRRRIRAQRGHQGAALCLSRSAGDIADLRDAAEGPFDARSRARSLPRPRTDEAEESASKDGDESGGDGGRRSATPERGWTERPRPAAAGVVVVVACCGGDTSSGSDTLGSPARSASAGGAHKDERRSSSGNWSGSSGGSACPSQTSETPETSPLARCDSELSLNADERPLVGAAGPRGQRAGSFSSTAMDILEEAGGEGECEWSFPPPSGEAENSLGCPSFASVATCESSFSDRPPSEKADTLSRYSEDTEGYYTSMHFDCGLVDGPIDGLVGSRSFTCGYSERRHRRLALRKPKCKPRPPRRSSSLGTVRPEEVEMAPMGARDPLFPLVDDGSFKGDEACSFRGDGAVRPDYADLWLLHDSASAEPYRSLSADPYRSLSLSDSSTATGATVAERVESRSGSGATTPSLTPAEEGDAKLGGLGSPSSGYSSQSETPTSAFPAVFFPGPMSPGGAKRKPKVPERKSSLALETAGNGEPSPKDGDAAEDEPSPSVGAREEPHLSFDDAVDVFGEPPILEPSEGRPAFSSDEELVNGETMSSPPPPEDDDDEAESSLSPPDEDLCPETASPTDGGPSVEGDKGRDGLEAKSEDAVEENKDAERETSPADDGSGGSVFSSPARSRTTDDLFAAIHRSKRKVLGRKDSGELSPRNGTTAPGSSPATSPGPAPSPASTNSPCGPQKTPGPIYRNVKKSSTSNEEFKLLLLKKGSRSESGYRMSAAEILKSPRQTDEADPGEDPETSSPRPRPLGEDPEAFSPGPRAWAWPQGRPGRARAPPPANGGRYAARARFYSAPMQAISEGEAENSDGSGPRDDDAPARPRFA